MPTEDTIPKDIQRFILRCIDSVPHLEVLLLLSHYPSQRWDAKKIAHDLFIEEQKIEQALMDLSAAGFLNAARDAAVILYCFAPVSSELEHMVARLDDIYSKKLIEITNLIHSKANKQAQQFGDAFKLRDGKE